jgi:hypothetical protein
MATTRQWRSLMRRIRKVKVVRLGTEAVASARILDTIFAGYSSVVISQADQAFSSAVK